MGNLKMAALKQFIIDLKTFSVSVNSNLEVKIPENFILNLIDEKKEKNIESFFFFGSKTEGYMFGSKAFAFHTLSDEDGKIGYIIMILNKIIHHYSDFAGVFLAHAAGLSRQGEGYLFFGDSKDGKTTLTKSISDDFQVINDDAVIVHHNKGIFFLSPFPNDRSDRLTNDLFVPLKKVFVIYKSSQNRLLRNEMNDMDLEKLKRNSRLLPTEDTTISKTFHQFCLNNKIYAIDTYPFDKKGLLGMVIG